MAFDLAQGGRFIGRVAEPSGSSNQWYASVDLDELSDPNPVHSMWTHPYVIDAASATTLFSISRRPDRRVAHRT